MSTLYVMAENGGDGNYKIGRTSKDLGDRIRRVQTGNPHPLFYTVIARGLGWMEGALHEAFSSDRLHGEWFRRAGPTEAFVDHLWATCEGVTSDPADVLEAASLALRMQAGDRKGREFWTREEYERAGGHLQRVAQRLAGHADDLNHERLQRFDPDALLPSFAEALARDSESAA